MKNIYEALLAFQKLNIKVTKDAQNPFHKNNYSTLNNVLEVVRRPLSDLGVLIYQKPCIMGGLSGVETTLFHVESETLCFAFMPYVGATDSQKQGSANTYNRRYSLVTMLNLEDTDDDGNVASNYETPKTTNKPANKPTGDFFVASTGGVKYKGEWFNGQAADLMIKAKEEGKDLDKAAEYINQQLNQQ